VSPERWIPFFILTFILGALLQLPFLMTLSASLAFIMIVMNWWRRRALDNISYVRRPFYRRGFSGEVINLKVEIENRKLLPLSWLRIEDPIPTAIGPDDESLMAPSHVPDHSLLTNVLSMRWFQRIRRSYDLVFQKRGVYKIGPARLRSGDLFGLYEESRELDDTLLLTVYPELLPMKALDLPAEDPFGDRKARRRLFEDPNQPMGVREYRPEDSFRRVHWPATARTGELQVRVFQPTSARVMVVCLNVSTFERHWEGVYPPLLERLISTASSIAYHAVEDGYQVGLISNGCLAHSDTTFRVPPGRSPRQLSTLLQVLAGVTPIVRAPFVKFLMDEMPSVHFGARVLVVTAVTSLSLMESLLKLKKRGRRVTLLSLAKEPPEVGLENVNFIHLPFEEEILENSRKSSADGLTAGTYD
jgi:uncharacterized protein (DUF58 family)